MWVHEEAVLIRTADDAPPYWQGFILDITERKQAEEQLRQAEERFRLIVERTPAVTYQEAHTAAGTYDLSTLTSYVSPQIEAIIGFPAARWNEPGFWVERIYPEDRERVQAESSAASDSGEPYRQDYRMIAADGRIVWFHDESQLIRDDDGRPLYWQGVMVDITDRKEAEEQLRQAEERFRSIVERTPAIVYQELPSSGSQRNASVVFVSSQIERILGYATGCLDRAGGMDRDGPSRRPSADARHRSRVVGRRRPVQRRVPDDRRRRPRACGSTTRPS